MGYALSSLGNLPLQDSISLYIFVIGTGWQGDPEYDILEKNFMQLAHRIGPTAIIAKGFELESWSTQVCERYLGKGVETMYDVFPALLLTDTHPDRLTDASMRLLVPLREAQRRFGGVPAFFNALVDFAQTRAPGFLSRFKEKPSLGEKAWSVVELKPNFFWLRREHQRIGSANAREMKSAR